MLEKFLCGCAACAALCCFLSVRAQAIAVNADGAVLVEAQSGRVLFAQEEDKQLAMASTTKIMTAMLTLEQPGLDEYFTVDASAIRVEGSSMGLTEGDSVTLRGLATGMLLASGNDAANAAAVRIAGSQPAFVAMMNERAQELGMTNTSFETPSGLDGDTHYSTARDMAVLACEALRNPAFAAICSQYRTTLEFGNPPFTRWLKNHNRLLQDYEGAIGVKTGFTRAAGRCLVSAAERDGITLIAVTLASPDDWRDHAALLDYGFAQLQNADFSALVPQLAMAVGGGVWDAVAITPPGAVTAALLDGEQERVTAEVLAPPFVLAPVQKGAVMGELRLMLDGKELMSVPLCATDDVPARTVHEPQASFFQRIIGWIADFF